jgi:hypothetical protein
MSVKRNVTVPLGSSAITRDDAVERAPRLHPAEQTAAAGQAARGRVAISMVRPLVGISEPC